MFIMEKIIECTKMFFSRFARLEELCQAMVEKYGENITFGLVLEVRSVDTIMRCRLVVLAGEVN